jgi:hypothetical protein
MNRAVFASLTILCLLSVLLIAGLIQVVKADGGTIYIRADGSIDPPTIPISTVDNVTYTLTGNINNDSSARYSRGLARAGWMDVTKVIREKMELSTHGCHRCRCCSS